MESTDRRHIEETTQQAPEPASEGVRAPEPQAEPARKRTGSRRGKAMPSTESLPD